MLHAGALSIDLERRSVRRDGAPVELTATEFDLLAVLAREPGRAFTRAQLVERVYDASYAGYDRTVDAHIKNLRRKIEPDPRNPRYILMVYGVGYKFADDAGRDGRRPVSRRTGRPQLFTLMLLAFALVIVLGMGGMVGFFCWPCAASRRCQAARPRFSDAAIRGMLSAGLALAAVLLGWRFLLPPHQPPDPARRRRRRARMAAGDMSVRVAGRPCARSHDLAQAFNTMADSWPAPTSSAAS